MSDLRERHITAAEAMAETVAETTAIDEGEASRRCPVCGEPNGCALLIEDRNDPCWCVSVEPATDLLESLPQDVRGRVCLCRRCLSGGSSAQD